MPTITDSLGKALPVPSVPPKTIFESSSNEDVKLWIYYALKENQAYLSNDDAWALAREVKGTGGVVLTYSREDWEKEIPGWGHTIHSQLHRRIKYVKSDLELTKIIGLIFVAYTFSLRLIQAILSSQWAHQWKRYPEILKLRRKGDNSFWKDFAGIPK